MKGAASWKRKKGRVWRPAPSKEEVPEPSTKCIYMHPSRSCPTSPPLRSSLASGSSCGTSIGTSSGSGRKNWADIMDQEEDEEEDTTEHSTCLPISSPRTRSQSPSLVTGSEFSDAGTDMWWGHDWQREHVWDEAYAPQTLGATLEAVAGGGHRAFFMAALARAPEPFNEVPATVSHDQLAKYAPCFELDGEARHTRNWQRSVDTAKKAALQHQKFLKMSTGASREIWLPNPNEAVAIEEQGRHRVYVDGMGHGLAGESAAESNCFLCGDEHVMLVPADAYGWPNEGGFDNSTIFLPEVGCIINSSTRVSDVLEHQSLPVPHEQFAPWDEASGTLYFQAPLAATFANFEESHDTGAGCVDIHSIGHREGCMDPLQHRPEATMVMIHSIPDHYTHEMLCSELNNSGFEGQYDFVHVPVHTASPQNLLHAFVNFISPSVAAEALRRLEGHTFCQNPESAEHSWSTAAPLQGLASNVEHHRNTAPRPIISRRKSSQ